MRIDDSDLPPEIRHAARRLAGDPAFAAALKYLEWAAWTLFAGSAPEDEKQRDVAYHQYLALQQLRELIDRWSRASDQEDQNE